MTSDSADDGVTRKDVLDSTSDAGRKRRGVLRGAAAAVAGALGVAAGGGSSDLASMIGTAEASDDPSTQETFCTYQCIDGTCGCRRYYVDTGFQTCYDYGEWCCTDCTGCEDDCPY